MSAFSHSFVTVKGCATSLWRGGSGGPLLFLHGSQGVPKPLAFMEKLAERFDVIIPEHPGFGRSDTPDWFEDIHDVAYFYLGFLEALQLSKVDVIGQAIGGWIAAEFAIRNTTRLNSLVLVGAPGLDVPDPAALDVFAINDAELAEFLFYDRELATAARARVLNAGRDPIAEKNRQSLTRLAFAPRFHDPGLHKWLDRIDIPTLIVWGADDRAVSPKIGAAYHALIPGSRLTLLKQCGHLPHVEKPEEYLRVILDFIAEVHAK